MPLKQRRLYSFGDFRLDPTTRTLTREGVSIPLFPKCFDVLLYLVENPGRLITKDELLRGVWTDAFVEESNLSQNVSLLRKALDDRGNTPRYIVTVPGKGYQFAATPATQMFQEAAVGQDFALHAVPERLLAVVERPSYDHEPAAPHSISNGLPVGLSINKWKTATVGALVLAAAAGGWLAYKHFRGGHALVGQSKLVLADFTGSPGDASLNAVLRGALAVDLRQSPYFTFLSQADIQNTLSQMGQPKNHALTADVAREVCQRNNAQAVVNGAIARLGQHYLITLEAAECASGNELANGKKEVANPDAIPAALDELAAGLRRKLGESTSSVQKFSTPLFPENTGSLEALKSFSEGENLGLAGQYFAAIPHFERAIELDPKFAVAYLDLSAVYYNVRERGKAILNLKTAYALRDNAGERDRLFIVSRYHEEVTGDLWESVRNYRTWSEMYPANPQPWGALSEIYLDLGQPEQAVELAKHALTLHGKGPEWYVWLARAQLNAGQFREAQGVCRQALSQFAGSGTLHGMCMQVDYALHDSAAVNADIAWGQTNPEGARVQENAGRIALAEGRIRQGQMLMQQVGDAYRHQGLDRMADFFTLADTRILAEEGLTETARQVLKSVPLQDGMVDPVVALAETGDALRAAAILRQDLAEHPSDTLWQHRNVPQIQAAIQLAQHKPQQAIAALEAALPNDYGTFDLPYLRGLAFLAANAPDRAAVEFQKIVDHPGIEPISYVLPLAFLGIARSRALLGQEGPSRDAYEKFFSLWKNADADVPVLVSARKEYARLNQK
jgi:eukaryotic-like serine/threonine-protein kinase